MLTWLFDKFLIGRAWVSPSLRDCVDGISVCMYVCMYVYMYGGHSVLHSNSKLHGNFGKMETRACPRMPHIILVVLESFCGRWQHSVSLRLTFFLFQKFTLVNCVVNTCIQWNLSIAVTHGPKICGPYWRGGWNKLEIVNTVVEAKFSSKQRIEWFGKGKKKMASTRTHTTVYFPGNVCLPGAINLAVKWTALCARAWADRYWQYIYVWPATSCIAQVTAIW